MQHVYKVDCEWTCLGHFHLKIALHSYCIFPFRISNFQGISDIFESGLDFVFGNFYFICIASRRLSDFQRLVVISNDVKIWTLVLAGASYISYPR